MWQLRVAMGLNRRERENFSRHPGAFRYKTPIPRHKSIRVGAFSVTRNGREWCNQLQMINHKFAHNLAK